MKERLYEEFLNWIDDEEHKAYQTILEEDDETWHRIIWVVAYYKKDCIKVQVIRVFTADEKNIALSIDLENEYKYTDGKDNALLDAIVDVVKTYEKAVFG